MPEEIPIPHIIYVDEAGEHLFVPNEPTPPDPPPESQAMVEILLPEMTLILDPAQGEALDHYIDPQGDFITGNVLCTTSLPGFRAYYRADEDGDREEWVFEYGDPWVTPPSASLPPYSVTVTCANGDLVHLEAPVGHYWFSRWRWQSEPRPVRRTYEELAALDLIPHLDPEGLAEGAILTVAEYQPMSYCGIPADQGQTGGYPGLGIMTGWIAQYLTRGAPESSFRNQAEASGSFQAHVRDTNTHAPIDIVTDYPSATMYSASQGNPYIPRGPAVNRTDQGHMPSVSYIPFLLTGDPYHLEELQFWANHNMLTQPANSRFMVAGRYLAWPLKMVFEAYNATPDNVPSWLLPRSYWTHWLDVCRGHVESRMANTADPYYYAFHTIPDTGPSNDKDPHKSGDHVWQQDMLDLVGAFVATTRDEWVAPAEWLIYSAMSRASATSGWVRSRCSPYHMRLQNASVLREAMNQSSDTIRLQYAQNFTPGMTVKIDSESFVLSSSSNNGLDWTFQRLGNAANHNVKAAVYGDKCTSWCQAASLNVMTYGWAGTEDNDHLVPSTTDLTYPSYERCALAQAITAGLATPGIAEAYTWLDGEIRRWVAHDHLPVGDNWTVMPVPRQRRRIRRRSDATDPQTNPVVAALMEEIVRPYDDPPPDEYDDPLPDETEEV